MKGFLQDLGALTVIILLELLALATSALMITFTTFMAWHIVIHPVLGLPALTFGQIFLCAWAFLFAIAAAEQAKYYFGMIEYVDETKQEERDDNDKKS